MRILTTIQSRRLAPLALVAAALALALVLLLDGGGDGQRLRASFERVNGVVVGADVRAGGINVGRVKDIELGDDRYPLVEMRLHDDFELRRGATASVRFFSVGGEANRVIDLTQGEGAPLGDEVELPRTRTDVPEEIDEVLSLLDPGTRKEVHRLFAQLDRGTQGRGSDIAAALRAGPAGLRETAGVLEQLHADGRALRQVVTGGRDVLAALAQDPAALQGAVDRLGDLLSTTARRQGELRDTFAAAPGALGKTERALARLRRSVAPLRAFVADARPGLRRLADQAPALDATLAAARPALAQLRGLVGQRGDVRRLRALVDVAQPTLRELRPMLASALPILGETRARFPDAFGFLANWNDFHSTYDAAGPSGRVGLMFAPTPTNSITGADSGPGMLELPFVRDPGALVGEPWTDYRKTIVGAPDEEDER